MSCRAKKAQVTSSPTPFPASDPCNKINIQTKLEISIDVTKETTGVPLSMSVTTLPPTSTSSSSGG